MLGKGTFGYPRREASDLFWAHRILLLTLVIPKHMYRAFEGYYGAPLQEDTCTKQERLCKLALGVNGNASAGGH
jgi:hypothetical protein